jgi:pimeloyl-ACP methyl ester carboxylesterase
MVAKTIELWIEDHKLIVQAYNEDKGGTPLIFIHGVTSSVSFWEPSLPKEIKAGYRWYSLPLPGHYPSVVPPRFHEEHLTPEMIVRVLTEAIYRLAGDKPVIVIGYSTGGYAAVHLAAYAPGIVKGVVSVCGFVQGTWTGALGMNQKIAAFPVIGDPWFRAAYWLMGRPKRLWGQAWSVYTPDPQALFKCPTFQPTVDGGHEDFKRLDFRIMAMYFRRFPHIDISGVLSQIRVPMLIIAGEQDPIVPPAQSQLIAQQVQGSELKLIAGSGHVPMFDRGEEFNRVLIDWLSKHA